METARVCVEGYKGGKLGSGCVGQMETTGWEWGREGKGKSWQGYWSAGVYCAASAHVQPVWGRCIIWEGSFFLSLRRKMRPRASSSKSKPMIRHQKLSMHLPTEGGGKSKAWWMWLEKHLFTFGSSRLKLWWLDPDKLHSNHQKPQGINLSFLLCFYLLFQFHFFIISLPPQMSFLSNMRYLLFSALVLSSASPS